MFMQNNQRLTVPSIEFTTIELVTDRAFLNTPSSAFCSRGGNVRDLRRAAILTFFWILAVISPDVLPRESIDSHVDGTAWPSRRQGR